MLRSEGRNSRRHVWDIYIQKFQIHTCNCTLNFESTSTGETDWVLWFWACTARPREI